MMVSEQLKSKLVIDMQDLADDYRKLERPWLSPLISTYFAKIYKIMENSDLVVVTTEYVKDVLEDRIKHDNIVVVPNGVDLSEFKSKCKWERDIEEIRGLFLGDLNYKYHAVDVLLKAVAILKKRRVKILIDVVGYGVLLRGLVKLAKSLNIVDEVNFHGYVSRESIYKIMSNAHFGVLSRLSYENLWILSTIRLTTYEYLACGLPLLAYGPPNSYMEWFVKSKGVGIYVPSNRPEDVAEGIQRIIYIIRSSGEELFNHCVNVAAEYDWKLVMKKFVSYLSKI